MKLTNSLTKKQKILAIVLTCIAIVLLIVTVTLCCLLIPRANNNPFKLDPKAYFINETNYEQYVHPYIPKLHGYQDYCSDNKCIKINDTDCVPTLDYQKEMFVTRTNKGEHNMTFKKQMQILAFTITYEPVAPIKQLTLKYGLGNTAVNGFKYTSVKDITYNGKMARVTFIFDEPIMITDVDDSPTATKMTYLTFDFVSQSEIEYGVLEITAKQLWD